MALAPCQTAVDSSGRELVEHGTTGLPVACYHDDLGRRDVPWHWHDELEAAVVTEGCAVVSAGESKRVIRATVDTTPIRYLRQYRIRQAARLLCHTEERISDIASRKTMPWSFCACPVRSRGSGLRWRLSRRAGRPAGRSYTDTSSGSEMLCPGWCCFCSRTALYSRPSPESVPFETASGSRSCSSSCTTTTRTR